MDVNNELVYRVISVDKAEAMEIGDIVPIPIERDNSDGNQRKIETENVFEDIRKDFFPHLLSRQSVLFVLPFDQTLVRRWVELHNPHNNYDYVLCTLEVTGSLFWCDEDKFTQAGYFPAFRQQLAIDYWRSANRPYELMETAEGLFTGTAIIRCLEVQHYDSPYLD